MQPAVSGNTQICGLIGHPVSHSLSPAMHNAAFRSLGLDYLYLPFPVTSELLAQAIEGVRGLQWRGANITIPHKTAVMPYLDRIDPLAQQIGAVNTVVNDHGCLTGYNTDADGFWQALREVGIQPVGKRAVLIGAGGAAKAVAFILAQQGVTLHILNRTQPRAITLAHSLTQTFGQNITVAELTHENLANALATSELLIQSTSVGMHEGEPRLIPPQLLRHDLAVCDLIYRNQGTPLLRDALAIGATVMDGVGMLVWQGALAFERWTGLTAPVTLMRSEVIRQLANRARS